VLPALWSSPELAFSQLVAYFAGKTIQVDKGGYTEPMMLPRASRETLENAVRDAVKTGYIWLTVGPTSLYQEDVPPGILTNAAHLQAPPQPITAAAILPQTLPEAWSGEQTTARGIADALSTRAGKPLPWTIVRQAIDGAFAASYLVRADDSGPWPCDAGGASAVHIQLAVPVISGSPTLPPVPPKPSPGILTAEADLRPNEIQNLADQIGELTRLVTTAGVDLRFHLRIDLGDGRELPADLRPKLSKILESVKNGLTLH